MFKKENGSKNKTGDYPFYRVSPLLDMLFDLVHIPVITCY